MIFVPYEEYNYNIIQIISIRSFSISSEHYFISRVARAEVSPSYSIINKNLISESTLNLSYLFLSHDELFYETVL
jgi:hypothetical protein